MSVGAAAVLSGGGACLCDTSMATASAERSVLACDNGGDLVGSGADVSV